jgi:hypothetical protein
MPLIETKGAASAQGFGEFTQTSEAVYIESCFSTYLYTGNGSTQTITNGIDLSTKGGMVWMKSRSAATDHALYDTVRGATKDLVSNSQAAETTQSTGLTSFASTGFSIGALAKINTNAATYVSWTFREQPKFYDVVTYTGNGSNRTIAHNLNSVPGCIIVKRTDASANWQVYHRSLANTEYLVLNDTAAKATGTTRWNSTTPTSTVFSLGTDTTVNASGGTYVAYLFAHDAGGFGLSGTDNVISCGSFTTDASGNATVNLGYEPQWLTVKASSTAGNWFMRDNMRGWVTETAVGTSAALNANLSNAEALGGGLGLSATGFVAGGLSSSTTYIYIAIRRGPMKVPTSGTSVFSPKINGGGVATITTNFSSDSVFFTDNQRSAISGNPSSQSEPVIDKLRGSLITLNTMAANGEQTQTNGVVFNNTGFVESLENSWGVTSNNCTYWAFQRAPNFFDEVCYTGTGSNQTVTHNLGAVPELMFVKQRNGTNSWWVYDAINGNTKYMLLNTSLGPTVSSTAWNNTTPTSTVFTVGTSANVNGSGNTYIAYLFASLAGVSKIGSYTGTGGTQTINCGFAGGVRFVLIKRSDATTGNWYCFDTANGMTVSSSPYLLWDSGVAQTTGNNGCYTASTGFTLTSNANGTVNINSAPYIYLAIA